MRAGWLAVPVDPSPPSGYTVRPATLDDVDIVSSLMAESAQAAIGEDDVAPDEVRDALSRPSMDLERDTVLAWADDRLVGYGEVTGDHPERVFVDVYLSPALPEADYLRLGSWLAGRCVERASQLVSASDRPGLVVAAGCYRQETRLAAVLEAAGFDHVRTFWRMSVDLDESHLTPPPLPDGVTIRALDVDDPEDARLAHRLKTIAFREHFGEAERTLDDYWEEHRSSSTFDPTQWWVAEVSDVPAGLLCGTNQRDHENDGWVRSLGVLGDYRGRGVGQAMLRHAFAEFRRRGRDRAMLAVDAENETGATRLYESVGMTPVLITDAYRLTP